MTDKIVRMPGVAELAPEKPVDYKAIAATLREAFEARAEFLVEIARFNRQKYEAYVAVGFTEAQALELCK